MSKPISFGFGKTKTVAPTKPPTNLTTPKRKPANGLHDSDNEYEEEPKHESVTGFSTSGAILSQPVQEKPERVIENAGNSDWRRRDKGQNLLPAEVQAARNGEEIVMVEKNEVSKTSGLQFAEQAESSGQGSEDSALRKVAINDDGEQREMTEDEIAMQALVNGTHTRRSNAIIKQLGNTRLSVQDETTDFRADVATRPESSTLEEYAAMPVEEFGMAMLRGMGQKRRANGEVISLNGDKADENPRKQRKQEGFLGIGAKAAPGSDVELGAWGKADMRKNNRGEGFFTPLMRENKATGERLTEEELQDKLKASKNSKATKDEEDWRERRDRNLERSGRDRNRRDDEQRAITNGNGDDYRDQMNSFSRHSSSSRRDRDERDYDSSSSRRERSRSRDRRRRHDDEEHGSRHRDKHRERRRDDERYDSSSSHRSRHRDDRDRDHGRHR